MDIAFLAQTTTTPASMPAATPPLELIRQIFLPLLPWLIIFAVIVAIFRYSRRGG